MEAECPKCSYENPMTGCHETDEDEYECQDCGFEFVVEIEYDPSCSTSCKACDFAEWCADESYPDNEIRQCRICGHCETRTKAEV